MVQQLHWHKDSIRGNVWHLVEDNGQGVPITSIRKNEVPGTHTVTHRSEIDEISITHTAHNRTGFALGAIIAAEWIKNKKVFLA